MAAPTTTVENPAQNWLATTPQVGITAKTDRTGQRAGGSWNLGKKLVGAHHNSWRMLDQATRAGVEPHGDLQKVIIDMDILI